MKFLRIFGIPLLALIILGLTGLLALLSIPTLFIANEIGFNFKNVHAEKSPDEKYQLIIKKRIAFPANEIIDPAIIARFELHSCKTGELVDSTEIYMEEYGDLFVPKTMWRDNGVLLSDFYQRRKYEIDLKDYRLQTTIKR